jgi:hypothetical protein
MQKKITGIRLQCIIDVINNVTVVVVAAAAIIKQCKQKHKHV